ncbi:hypothetical protein ASPZODRAFT_67086 [Penicilliopsis zonata CBS 506.65]|uniref:Glycoside hydrolase family 5 domain-containing protein n=1 Tax=Penicilliopsis zonata CBS 506.65 TaxID=1073090 RepID=A0A1L9SG16_9EURO|nr:hypothetical protein ASPZODRAFT_67086 [Penicilliopsis zonata CBS 506.65]OJJ46027.1 hypothetical protein ASPZODRAFT_67086 [Penicilliopsis zonata CBS 506.65]
MRASAVLLFSVIWHVLPTSASLNTPLSVSGRWIVDSTGANVTYAGTNWSGDLRAMIPEGLQYASISSTVSKIKSLGMNAIRLTFATEMVDDILDNGGDVTVKESLDIALGSVNGSKVWDDIQAMNPQITESTTRLQVFDMLAAECAAQDIYIHLDNHVSKAEWCCSETDGNAWWGDTYFDVPKWKRGLEYMVEHAKTWPNYASIGLRNEPRQPEVANAEYPYTWQTWYEQMTDAARLVHAANADTLIFLAGLDYDTTLAPIPTGAALDSAGTVFNLSSFAFADKLVLEIHNYDTSATSCATLASELWSDGFDALDTTDSSAIANVMPVVLTEFGFLQDSTTWEGVYATCLRDWIPQIHAGWTVWTLAGSYYIREGIEDYDETWVRTIVRFTLIKYYILTAGMLNHNWSDWRSPDAIVEGLAIMIDSSSTI